MSSYTGLFVYRSENGEIDSVQVSDPHGNSLSLDIDTYIERGIQPPFDSLPDQNEFKK